MGLVILRSGPSLAPFLGGLREEPVGGNSPWVGVCWERALQRWGNSSGVMLLLGLGKSSLQSGAPLLLPGCWGEPSSSRPDQLEGWRNFSWGGLGEQHVYLVWGRFWALSASLSTFVTWWYLHCEALKACRFHLWSDWSFVTSSSSCLCVLQVERMPCNN